MPTDEAVVMELQVIRKLLAAQLFHTLDQTDSNQKTKIRVLARAGLGYREIADLLGSTPNAVAVALVALRKEGLLPQVAGKKSDAK